MNERSQRQIALLLLKSLLHVIVRYCFVVDVDHLLAVCQKLHREVVRREGFAVLSLDDGPGDEIVHDPILHGKKNFTMGTVKGGQQIQSRAWNQIEQGWEKVTVSLIASKNEALIWS